MRVALCPGSFDPVTYGHLDIVERAARLFDRCYVTIFHSGEKSPIFTVEERLELLRAVTSHLPNVEADHHDGLLAEYARARGIHVAVRGLRAVTDFEYEFKMAQMNKHLNPGLETIFVMARPELNFLSSGLIREVSRWQGSVTGLVPPIVEQALREKFRKG